MQTPRANSASRPSSSGQPTYYPNQQYPPQLYNQQPPPYGQPPVSNVNIPPQNYPQNAPPGQYPQQQQWQQPALQQYQQQQPLSPEMDPQWADYYRKLDEWHRYQQYRREVVAQQQTQQQQPHQQQIMMQQQQMLPPQQQQQPQPQQFQQAPKPKQQAPPQPKQSTPQLIPPGGPWPGNIQNAVQFYLSQAEKHRQHLQQKQAANQSGAIKSQPELATQQSNGPQTSQPQLQVPSSQSSLPPPPQQIRSGQQIQQAPLLPQQIPEHVHYQQQLPTGPTQQSSLPAEQGQPYQPQPFPSNQTSFCISPQQIYHQQVLERSQSPVLTKKTSNVNNKIPEPLPSTVLTNNQPTYRSQPQNIDKQMTAPQVGQFISTATFNANQAGTNVSQFDLIKARLKSTRDKIYILIGREETEMELVDKEIQVEKNNGLKNKKKAVYLLKQRKHFQENIENLQTRMQVLVKTLSSLNQQNMDKEIIDVLEQSNRYMQAVQEELERRGWRQILEEARYRPDDAFAGLAEDNSDPEIDKMYAELERQVTSQNMKSTVSNVGQQKPPSSINIPPSAYQERVIEVPLIQNTEASQLNRQQEIASPMLVGAPSSEIRTNTSTLNNPPPQVFIQPPSTINSGNPHMSTPASMVRPPQQPNVSTLSVTPSQQQTFSQTSSMMRSEVQRQQQQQAPEMSQHTSAIQQPQQLTSIQPQSNIKPSSAIHLEPVVVDEQQQGVPSTSQINSGTRPSAIKYVSKMQVVVEEEPQFASVMSKKNSQPEAQIQDQPAQQTQFASGANVIQMSRLSGSQVQLQQQEPYGLHDPCRPPSVAITISPPQPGSHISIPPPFIPPPPQMPQQLPNQFGSAAQNNQNIRNSGVSAVQRSTIPPKPAPMHPSMYTPNSPATTPARHASDVVFNK